MACFVNDEADKQQPSDIRREQHDTEALQGIEFDGGAQASLPPSTRREQTQKEEKEKDWSLRPR